MSRGMVTYCLHKKTGGLGAASPGGLRGGESRPAGPFALLDVPGGLMKIPHCVHQAVGNV